jgi:exopolysaccharide biosynthesis protein
VPGAPESLRIELDDGKRTTVHLAAFPRHVTRVRVAALGRPRPLTTWCAEAGVAHAIVGGFFVRPGGVPLGEVVVNGRRVPSVAFDPPRSATRACVAASGGRVKLAPRHHLPRHHRGDLLQAGPMLVAAGRALVHDDGSDPEGFSSGSRQFDSDITVGRFPRAALALTRERLLALACDGRHDDDAGLTLGELAGLLVQLGARAAINLDGGGSTSLVYDGRLVNRPREEHGVELVSGRPISTALAFLPPA